MAHLAGIDGIGGWLELIGTIIADVKHAVNAVVAALVTMMSLLAVITCKVATKVLVSRR